MRRLLSVVLGRPDRAFAPSRCRRCPDVRSPRWMRPRRGRNGSGAPPHRPVRLAGRVRPRRPANHRGAGRGPLLRLAGRASPTGRDSGGRLRRELPARGVAGPESGQSGCRLGDGRRCGVRRGPVTHRLRLCPARSRGCIRRVRPRPVRSSSGSPTASTIWTRTHLPLERNYFPEPVTADNVVEAEALMPSLICDAGGYAHDLGDAGVSAQIMLLGDESGVDEASRRVLRGMGGDPSLDCGPGNGAFQSVDDASRLPFIMACASQVGGYQLPDLAPDAAGNLVVNEGVVDAGPAPYQLATEVRLITRGSAGEPAQPHRLLPDRYDRNHRRRLGNECRTRSPGRSPIQHRDLGSGRGLRLRRRPARSPGGARCCPHAVSERAGGIRGRRRRAPWPARRRGVGPDPGHRRLGPGRLARRDRMACHRPDPSVGGEFRPDRGDDLRPRAGQLCHSELHPQRTDQCPRHRGAASPDQRGGGGPVPRRSPGRSEGRRGVVPGRADQRG